MSIYGGAVTGSTRRFLHGSEEVQSSDGLVLCISHRSGSRRFLLGFVFVFIFVSGSVDKAG